MTTIRSVEAFRRVHGRAPTVAEWNAVQAFNSPPAAPKVENDGRYCGYCYDPECPVCCDEQGNVREV